MEHTLISTVPVCPTQKKAWDTGVIPVPGDSVYLPPGTALVLGRVPWGSGIEITGPGEIFILYFGGGADYPFTWSELVAFVQILSLMLGLSIYLPMMWVLMGRLLRVYGVTWYGNADYTSTQTGAWDAVATWGGGGFPVAGDTATVSNTHVVTVQGPESCRTLTVDVGGTVTLDGQTNTVPAILTIETGGSTIANSGTIDSTGTGSTGYAEIKGISLEAWTGTQPSLGSGYWRFNTLDFQMSVNTGGGGCTVYLSGNTTWDAFTLGSGDTLIGNSYTMTLSGSLNMSSGTFTYGTSTISMTGAGTSLTTGSGAFNIYSLTISNTVSLGGRSTVLKDGGTLTCSSTFTLNQHLSAWDGHVTTFNNTGTITTGGTKYISFLFTGGTDRNVSTNLGTISTFSLRFVIDDTGSGNTTLTLQAAYSTSIDVVVSGTFPRTLTIATANYAFGCADLGSDPSLANGCFSPGSSTITLTGDLNFSRTNDAWNTSTETLVMSGSNKTLTTGSVSNYFFYNITVNDNTVFCGSHVYITTGGTLTVASGKVLTTGSGGDGSRLYLYDGAIASLANSGEIASQTSTSYLAFRLSATTSQTTGTLGTLTSAYLWIFADTSISGNGTVTLGGDVSPYSLLIDSSHASNTCTLDTDSGNDRAINTGDLTVNTRGGLTANGSTITCAGDVNLSAGVFTYATSTMILNTAGKRLTTGSSSNYNFYNLSYTAGGSSTQYFSGYLYITTGGTFTVAADTTLSNSGGGNGLSICIYDAAIPLFANSGTIVTDPSRFLGFVLSATTAQNLPASFGTLTSTDVDCYTSNGISGDGTLTMTGALTCRELIIDSADASSGMIVDTSGTNYAINCVDLTLAATAAGASTLIGNNSIITASGNCNFSQGTFTQGTSNITMTGSNKTITTGSGSDDLYSLTCSGSISLAGVTTYLATGGTLTVSTSLALGADLWLYDSQVTNLNNTGTISGASNSLRLVIASGDASINTTTAWGTLTTQWVQFRTTAAISADRTFTLKASLTTSGGIHIWTDDSSFGAIVDTENGVNHSLNCDALTLNTRCTITANGSTITCTGDVNLSAGTFTYGTSDLVMTGSTKTITMVGNQQLYDLTIEGTVVAVVTSLTGYVRNVLTVDGAGATFGVTAGDYFSVGLGGGTTTPVVLSNGGDFQNTDTGTFRYGHGGNSETVNVTTSTNYPHLTFDSNSTNSNTYQMANVVTALDIIVGDGTNADTLNTNSNNYALGCDDITISTNGVLVGNGSVITATGNVNLSAGTFTQGTSNLTMSGTSKVLTMGTNSKTIASLTVTGTITTAGGQSFTIQNAWNVGAAASFTVASGDNVSYNNYGTWTYNATGSITAADTTPTLTLKVTSSKSLPSGNGNFGNLNLTFDHIGGGAVTYTLGNNLTCKNISITDAAQDSIVDTDSGNHYPINCANLTVSTNGTLTANNSTLTCSGDVNLSAGTFTYNTSILRMTGSSKTLTRGSTSYQFYSLTISGTITLAGGTFWLYDGGTLTIDNTKTLTLGSGINLSLFQGQIATIANSGTILGDGTLWFDNWNGDRTLGTTGTLQIDTNFRLKGDESTADRTITLGSNFTTTGDVGLSSADGTYSCFVDLAGKDFTGATITIAVRSKLQSTQAAGSNTITTTGNITITGSMDLSTVTGTGTIEIDCSGTLSGAGTLTSTARTLTLNNMTFSLTAGQFTHSSGTVVTGSTSDMTITTAQTWNNVNVGASPGITTYQASQVFVGAVAVKNGDTMRIDANLNDVTLSWDGSASATLDVELGGTFDIINNTVNTAKIQSNDTTKFVFTNSGTVTWVESGGGGNQLLEVAYVDLQFTLTTGGAGADTVDLVMSGDCTLDDFTISSVDTFVVDCTSVAVTLTLAGGSTITNSGSFSFTGLSSTNLATITSDDTTKVIWSGTQPTLANPASTEHVQFGTSSSAVGIDFHTNAVDLDVYGTFQPDGDCYFEDLNLKNGSIMRADSSDIDHQVYGTLTIEVTGAVDLTNSTDYYVRGLNNFGVIIPGTGFIHEVGIVSTPPMNGPLNPAIPQAVTPVQWRDAHGHHRGGMNKGSGKKRRKRTPSR